jgi:hypothetical protein
LCRVPPSDPLERKTASHIYPIMLCFRSLGRDFGSPTHLETLKKCAMLLYSVLHRFYMIYWVYHASRNLPGLLRVSKYESRVTQIYHSILAGYMWLASFFSSGSLGGCAQGELWMSRSLRADWKLAAKWRFLKVGYHTLFLAASLVQPRRGKLLASSTYHLQ